MNGIKQGAHCPMNHDIEFGDSEFTFICVIQILGHFGIHPMTSSFVAHRPKSGKLGEWEMRAERRNAESAGIRCTHHSLGVD